MCCPKTCAPPVNYVTKTSNRSYTADAISDVSMIMNQQAGFLCHWCCCEEIYESAVRVTFGDFDQLHNTASLRVSSIQNFQDEAGAQFGNGMLAAAAGGLFGVLGAAMGPDPASLSFVDIVSYREDATAMDLEHPLLKDGFDGLVKIQKDIATLIAKSRPAVWNKLDLSTEGGAPFAKYCNSRGDLKLPSVKEITKDDDFAPLDMVKEGECAMPSTFVALADGESVIASTSNLYNLTCCDKIKCLLTCGLYYCCVLRKKRAERQGFVLTTHRLLTIQVARDESCLTMCCSDGVLCCCPTVKGLVVRSLYPREVASGVEMRKGKEMFGRVLTDAGALELGFCVKGDEMLGGKANVESTAAMRMAFLKCLTHTAKRTAGAALDLEDLLIKIKEMPNPPMEEDDKMQELALDEYENAVLPMLEGGEHVLARFNGKIYEDMCDPCCNNECTWYPGCMIACCCGWRPLFQKSAVIITDKTIYCIHDNSNDPKCCEKRLKIHNYAVFWAPLAALAGTELETVLVGTETCTTRCCYKKWCGDNCCPMFNSTASVKILLESFIDCVTVSARHWDVRRPLRNEPNIVRFRGAVGLIQRALANASATGPKIQVTILENAVQAVTAAAPEGNMMTRALGM